MPLSDEDYLKALYRRRFSERQLDDKRILWSTLCEDFFQTLVPREACVLDVGAGNCEFINAIQAGRKLAVDLNPATRGFADPDVLVLTCRADQLDDVESRSVDVVFSSNFFEHLPDKATLLSTLRECHRVTAPGGRIVVLMPNIRYVGGRYWDYLDHHLPLTHLSLAEGLQVSGYRVEKVVPRFLPYTVKDAMIPVRAWMVRAYLATPLVWRVMGKQMLVVARRPPD